MLAMETFNAMMLFGAIGLVGGAIVGMLFLFLGGGIAAMSASRSRPGLTTVVGAVGGSLLVVLGYVCLIAASVSPMVVVGGFVWFLIDKYAG